MPSPQIRFHLVDVFASRPLTGNPLALVPQADHLDIDRMRAVAREFNQSETTFLSAPSREDAAWRLRSFTPAGVEVGGAGHNALGAWLWLADVGLAAPGQYLQQIGHDLLPVVVRTPPGSATQVVMSQRAPSFGRAVVDLPALSSALGLRPGDIDDSLAVRPVSTGVRHLLVPVRGAAVVDGASPDSASLRKVLLSAGAEGCYVFTTDADAVGPLEAHAYARFFNPTVGIVEDPATGTAAGPLAAALAHAGRAPEDADVVIEQGHALGRPSRLVVRVEGDDVRLAGSGLVVGGGWLSV